MSVPRDVIDLLIWQGRPWWQRAVLRVLRRAPWQREVSS